MDVVREWARSVSLVAVLCSMILMLAPVKMKRNVAFVLEAVVLIAVLAPAWRWVSAVRTSSRVLPLDEYLPEGTGVEVFEKLRISEMRRQIEALLAGGGFRVEDVEIVTNPETARILRIAVKVRSGGAGALPGSASLDVSLSLRKLLALYSGVPESSVLIEAAEGGK